LKMRMPGLGGDVLREIGAAAINLPGGEIYQSLQSGAIDATEWVGPWNDLQPVLMSWQVWLMETQKLQKYMRALLRP